MRVCALCCVLAPGFLSAESIMYITPATGYYSRGEVFQVNVRIDADEPINAAEAELSYDTNVMRVTAISSAGSILKTWPTVPGYSNEEGIVSFSGWGDSFQGSGGNLVTVTFQALRPAQGNIQLSAGAALAVGQGSNVITTLKSSAYAVGAAQEQTEVIFAQNDEGPQSEEVSASTTEEAHDDGVSDAVQEVSDELPARVLITSYKEEVEAGSRSILRGRATPHSRVWVWMEHVTEKPIRSEVMSDDEGLFTFRSRELPEGTYRFRAEVYGNGVTILPSETVKVVANPSRLAAAAATSSQVISMVILGAGFVLLTGLMFGYVLYYRRKKVSTNTNQ